MLEAGDVVFHELSNFASCSIAPLSLDSAQSNTSLNPLMMKSEEFNKSKVGHLIVKKIKTLSPTNRKFQFGSGTSGKLPITMTAKKSLKQVFSAHEFN